MYVYSFTLHVKRLIQKLEIDKAWCFERDDEESNAWHAWMSGVIVMDTRIFLDSP